MTERAYAYYVSGVVEFSYTELKPNRRYAHLQPILDATLFELA